MSQINVKNLSNENEDGAPDIVGVSTFSATSYFVPPKGTTAQRPQNPQPGDLRFNTDTASLEYYRGDTIGWSQIEMTSPDLNGGVRGLVMGGELQPGAGALPIDYVTISTLGNAQDFGDLMTPQSRAGVTGNSTRGIFGGGEDGSGVTTRAQKLEYASTGNAIEFGSVLGKNVEYASACSSPIRAVWGGGSGWAPSPNNVITYRSIATSGSGVDFGDLTNAGQSRAAMSNAHGGL